MSDFGTLYDYALKLEAEAPAAVQRLAETRPSFLPMTKEMREKAEKEAKAAAEHEAGGAPPVAARAPDKK